LRLILHELQRFTPELWRLKIHGGSPRPSHGDHGAIGADFSDMEPLPGFIEAKLGAIEAKFGAIEAKSGAIEAKSGAMVAHPGAKNAHL
jgi:hypothetical protein